jgi:excisionase family DNA binding protein
MIQQRYHPAQLAAAAAALATTPQELLATLQQANQAKEADNGNAATGPRLLTLKECADRLHVCKRTTQTLIDTGALPARKQGLRFVRIRESDLLAFIDGMPLRPTRAGEVTP